MGAPAVTISPWPPAVLVTRMSSKICSPPVTRLPCMWTLLTVRNAFCDVVISAVAAGSTGAAVDFLAGDDAPGSPDEPPPLQAASSMAATAARISQRDERSAPRRAG